MMKKIRSWLLDVALSLFLYPAALLLRKIRKKGVRNLPLCRKILLDVGVFPIRDHYYEPFFRTHQLRKPLSEPRALPGIDWNDGEQLALLESFSFHEELKDLPARKQDELSFYLENGTFVAGDAEYLYNIIRKVKPRRFFEVGSGHSTLMAIRAIRKNGSEGYPCRHVCIEPYENRWLEKTGVTILRRKVEDVGRDFFAELGENDILFIDSSHMIRPQGDVLFEYLEVLPSLKQGVIVHLHDIFSPRDYPDAWVKGDVRFWNEQYLLEALLTSNRDWKIIGALNYLHHGYHEKLKEKCPFLTPESEPGSFYIRRI